MWRGFVGSCWLGPGCPVLRADTRENPVSKNGVMTGGKSVPDRSFVHPKKQVFGWNFFIKQAPYHFSGPNWLSGAFGRKIVPDENFSQFCFESPLKFVFPKNKFSV